MVADTGEDTIAKPAESSKSTASPSKGPAHEPYAVPVAPPNANILSASAGLNTAGGRTKQAGYLDGLRTIQVNDFKEVHQKPCVRDSLLAGISSGFGIGGVRAILGASVWTTCNWAVGSFVFGSLFMFEYCQRRRSLEKQGMKWAAEVIDQKRAEKRKKADEDRLNRGEAQEDS